MQMRLTLAVLFCILAVVPVHSKRRSASEWNSLKDDDWEEMDKSLQAGDAPEELVTDAQLEFQKLEKMKQAPPNPEDLNIK